MSDLPVPGGQPAPGSSAYFAPSRRQVLRWLAYGTAGVALAGCTSGLGSSGAGPAERGSGPMVQRGAKARGPLLVIVELGGGNDGLSTLVPFESRAYVKARPTLALGAKDVIDLGHGWGVNSRLASMHEEGLALIGGVGTKRPDLSHFEMLDRWAAGSPAGLSSQEKAKLGPGFLGRLCDAVRGDELFTGMSLKFGSAAGLRAAKAATTGLPPTDGSFLDGMPQNGEAFGRYLRQASRGPRDGMVGSAREATEHLLWIVDLLKALPPAPEGYPDTDFGLQMAVASRLARSEAGMRVIHVPMGISEYDTHAKHNETHPLLMTELNDGLAAFIKDMRSSGLGDRVLVATTSEFGRRLEEHSQGLDHGAASMMMMMGPVAPGIHGDPSPVDRLDDLGNLVATVTFDRYLATMAAWMDVDPGAVLSSAGGRAPAPIDGVLRA